MQTGEHFMSVMGNQRTSVSALMGAPILDAAGKSYGRVSEFAVAPQTDASRVEALMVRRAGGKHGDAPSLVPVSTLRRTDNGSLQLLEGVPAASAEKTDDYLMLERDLLDQQIIDVHGHKVVRVNDVDMIWESCAPGERCSGPELNLRIAEVEVGIRGAIRRLLKGLPPRAVDRLADRVRPSVIPWDFVDLIDRDPSRRVRLKIEQDRLSRMHPSDLADILEELAPAERQALFSSLDEEVAADTLEEVELKTQKTLIEFLDSERIAGIIEEMDPGAAADLLSGLSEEHSDAILDEMDPKERHELEELLDHAPDSAAGLMTTEYIALPASGTVADVFSALASFEGDTENVTDIFVLDAGRKVQGVVALSKMMLTPRETKLGDLPVSHVVCAAEDANGRKVAELFDKYNLRCLAVLDEENRPRWRRPRRKRHRLAPQPPVTFSPSCIISGSHLR